MAKPTANSRKLTDFTPDLKNANKHTLRGIAMLEDSLQELGAGRSIVVDKHNQVIAGNATLETAVQAGFEDAIVVPTDGSQLVVVQRVDLDLNSPRGRKLALADNRVSEVDMSWDADVLKSLQDEGLDLSTLWDEDELAELLASVNGDEPLGDPGAAIDRAEALREKYSVEKGQLWQIGRHRLLCGDAYSSEDVARLLDGANPDMLHIDPPYGIGIVKPSNGSSAADSGGAKPFGSTGETQRKGKNAVAFRNSVGSANTPHAKGALSHANLYPVMKGDSGAVGLSSANRAQMMAGAKVRNEIIQSNLYPVIQGDDRPFDPALFIGFAPVVVMWGANYYANLLPISSCWICWDKREGITRNNFADGELAWTNQNKPMRIFHHLWNGLHKGSQHGERRLHPTEKPVALFEEIGKMYADGGLWVDLFAGSGAQMVAAERTGATCYAMECEVLYVATIIERLAGMGLTPERVV